MQAASRECNGDEQQSRGAVTAVASLQEMGTSCPGVERMIWHVNIVQASEPTPQKPLRLWPGVALAVLLLLFKFGVPIVAPDAVIVVPVGSLGCAVAILL